MAMPQSISTMIGYVGPGQGHLHRGRPQALLHERDAAGGLRGGPEGKDCNDANGNIYPGATEICNGVDDDCDTQVDEGVKMTYYRDADSDSYGAPGITTQACSAPAGYVADSTDCNDGSAAVHLTMTGYVDQDGDTYTTGGAVALCTNGTLPAGYAAVQKGTDCNDANANIYPGATEICNGVDDDCDTQVDEGVNTTYYRDADSDSYGNPGVTTQACSAPAGYVANSTDCNDASAAIHPGATEICGDGIDQDCSGGDLVCSSVPTATLVSQPRMNEGFIFGNGQVVANGGDFIIDDQYHLPQSEPGEPIGIQDLGVTTLDATATVPATGYTFYDPAPGAYNAPIPIARAMSMPSNCPAAAIRPSSSRK